MGAVKVSIIDIPPELRLKIYRYCFVLETVSLKHPIFERWAMELTIPFYDSENSSDDNKDAAAADRNTPSVEYKNPNAASGQLLRTCKLCLDEGLPILYGENVLNFSSVSDLKYYYDMWGASAKALIKTVVAMDSGYGFRGMHPVIPHLKDMTSSQRFDFQRGGRHRGWSVLPAMTLKIDPFLGMEFWVKPNTPCNTFLKKLFSNNLSVQCGIIMDIKMSESMGFGAFFGAPAKTGQVRWGYAPHGDVSSKRTFTSGFDKSWPVEKYEALVGRFDG